MDQPHESDPGDTPSHRDDALRQALASRHDRQPFVPPAVDESVLGQARTHFALIRRQQRIRRRWRIAGSAASVAAVVGLGVWVSSPWTFDPLTPQPVAQRPAVITGDVNGDGVVDVLDMLALARKLEAGIAPPAHADVTGDGQVSFADVHALGRRIVALPDTTEAEEGPRL